MELIGLTTTANHRLLSVIINGDNRRNTELASAVTYSECWFRNDSSDLPQSPDVVFSMYRLMDSHRVCIVLV